VTHTVPPSGVAAGSLTAASCPSTYPAGCGDRLAPDATTSTFNADGQRTAVTTPAPAGQTGDETTSYTYDRAEAGSGNYTVRRCCEGWLTSGLPGRDAKTVAKNKYVLEPLLAVIGGGRLRDVDVADVENALAAFAATRGSSTLAIAHLALTRAITRAQAKNLVLRNVSALTRTPPDKEGRPGRSMTLAQATAVTTAAQAAGPRAHAYVMLSQCTGADRGSTGPSMGARRLRRPRQRRARPASVAGWRSARARGDTRTRKSRRTRGQPQLAVIALQALHDESRPGEGPVGASRPLIAATGGPSCWSSRTRGEPSQARRQSRRRAQYGHDT
jgi:hypothetical protein